jgi:hypothetical protein
MSTPYRGQWHGKERYFGLHYDLHAGKHDTELGLQATPEQLIPMLRLTNPDFVQTDCKGHPGYTSWFSQTPEASVPPGLTADALEGWRAATRQLEMPLHCHYSGIWDRAAGEKHPDWTQVDADGTHTGAPFGATKGAATPERVCPRSDYLDKLMIPQMLELIDRYEVDGFWVDGDLWASQPCYCNRCRAAFTERTGIAEPPHGPEAPHWTEWITFALDSFYDYVNRYAAAVHAHKPGVLVCSNWLQTFRNPGAPVAATDWISGDNTWVWGLDASRCEARFIATRGKPWDIMLWSFYSSHGMGDATSPWTFKPVEMLQQEAAVTLALGGNVQIYENPGGVRSGQLIPWRMELLGEVAAFVKARRELCQETETVPQIAVLHSEHHVNQNRGANLMWGVDVAPVQGAVFSLLEAAYNVDILDEWALLHRLGEFPVVVAPEQNDMSDEMVAALKAFVEDGGKLLLSGAGALARFGEDFLGVEAGAALDAGSYHVPAGDGSAPVYSERWQLLSPLATEGIGRLGKSSLLDDRLLPGPAWAHHQIGAGAVATVPFDLFRSFDRNRYPRVRQFVSEVVARLAGPLPTRVETPTAVDVILRRKGDMTLVHLLNRSSGLPNVPTSGGVDEIMPLGPIVIEIDRETTPASVSLAFEEGEIEWLHADGVLRVMVKQVRIHAAVVVVEP